MLSPADRVDRPGTIRAHYFTVDDFLPVELAMAMRRDIDAHFGEPSEHRPDTHQIWNYWFVPQMYTYLRTLPEKVIRPRHFQRFMENLKTWSTRTLGMRQVGNPYLSLYISGCRQNLHNDAMNGRFAFVYSLTRNERKTVGGGTIVLNEGDPFRSNLTAPAAGGSFYSTIEPRFNRLVIFDDRIPHGVELVEGSMDPVEGRFVLHGHLHDGGTVVEGELAPAEASRIVVEAFRSFFSTPPANVGTWQGPLVVRLLVGQNGNVEDCHIMVDRVVRPDEREWDLVIGSLFTALRTLQFQTPSAPSSVIQPMMFNGASTR